MASFKHTFESWVWRAWTFAAGAWRGHGIPTAVYFRVVEGPSQETLILEGVSQEIIMLEGSTIEPFILDDE